MGEAFDTKKTSSPNGNALAEKKQDENSNNKDLCDII